MKITSYAFKNHLRNPVKMITTEKEKNKYVTKRRYFTVKTIRQVNIAKEIDKTDSFNLAIMKHKEEMI